TFFFGIAVRQQIGRVIRDHHRNALIIMEATAQTSQRLGGVQEIHRRATAERDNELGPNEVKLALKEPATISRLVRERSAISRRPAFENVANINFLAFKSTGLDDFGQKLPR